MWQNDHNVYILGAGFSRDAGLPLISNFLDKMRDSHAFLREKGYDREADAVERVLAFRLQAASSAFRVRLDVENIEELFSLASAMPANSMATDVIYAIMGTLYYSVYGSISLRDKQTFADLKPGVTAPGKWKRREDAQYVPQANILPCYAELYTLYVAILLGHFSEPRPERLNTIITFNYDLIVEGALQVLGLGTDYGFGNKISVQYDLKSRAALVPPGLPKVSLLKLHGSSNWVASPTKGGGNQELQVFRTYAEGRKSGNAPLIVPPTWRKTFGDVLGSVWDKAVEAISAATRVVIIGFSAPRTDAHFKYLLAAGLQSNISLRQVDVVSPDAGDSGFQGRMAEIFAAGTSGQKLLTFWPKKVYDFLRSSSEAIGRKPTRLHNWWSSQEDVSSQL